MIKLPINLVWQLFGKIFNDLDINNLQKSFFSDLDVSPSDCYELVFGLTLRLLNETGCLHKTSQEGVSNSLVGLNIDKTISYNTLLNCEVYSKTYKYSWDCIEHRIFLKVLNICKMKSSSNFISQGFIKNYINNFLISKGIRSLDVELSIRDTIKALSYEYNFNTNELREDSLLNRNPEIYTCLCRFAHLILLSESQTTDISGASNINYSKLDWFIIQQYGVREVWNVINNVKTLKGKKHRNFQPTIFTGNCPSLKPDAVYIFDNCGINDTIIDVKLYRESYLDSQNRYRFGGIVNQLVTYKMMYPSYIKSYKEKCSRKDITYKNVNVWALHFRKRCSKEELKFRGTKLDVVDIGVYVIDMFEGCNVDDLDKQIYEFVHKYILKDMYRATM